jgi:hypothetical protein
MKGQSRQFHYVHDDMVSSDSDDLLFKARSIDMIALSPYADMESAILAGVEWDEYFARGCIPIQQVALFERAWYLLKKNVVERAGRKNHPMDVDEDTGEVIDPLDTLIDDN